MRFLQFTGTARSGCGLQKRMIMRLPARASWCSHKAMPGSEPIRVAAIDDDSSLLDGLRRIIDSAEGFVCAGAFRSIEDALPSLKQARPHVLLLDIQLPGMAGDEAVEALRGVCPGVEILMLTVFADREKVFTSICNGANGYLLKSTPPAQLLDAIRAARAGGSPMSPEIARHIVTLFQKGGSPMGRLHPLTPPEQRLLALLTVTTPFRSPFNKKTGFAGENPPRLEVNEQVF